MAKVLGVDILVKVNTGTSGSPVYTAAGSQRGATLNRSTDEIDQTDKASDGCHEGVPSTTNWSIDADGLLIEDDNAYAALETAFDSKAQVLVQVATPAHTYTGLATISDFPIEAPYDDNATYSVSLTGSGKLTKV